jgi:hypothetical protein
MSLTRRIGGYYCRVFGHHWVFARISLPRQDYCKRCGATR